MTALVAAETAVLVVLAVLVTGLLRSHAEILRRLHELGAGLEPDDPDLERPAELPARFAVDGRVPAPAARGGFTPARDLSGAGIADDALAVRVTGVPHRTLLAFLSSSCLTCHAFWEALRDGDLGLPDDVRLVVVAKDAAEESPSRLAELAPRDVPVVCSSGAWRDYDVPGSPYFVLVDGVEGRVRGEGTGAAWPQVRALLAQATGDEAFVSGAAPSRRGRAAVAVAEASREARIDRELREAGIGPQHPSLYPPVAAPRTPAHR
jgi:hypothetical protein